MKYKAISEPDKKHKAELKDWGLCYTVDTELEALRVGYEYRNNPHGYKITKTSFGKYLVVVWNEKAGKMGCDV